MNWFDREDYALVTPNINCNPMIKEDQWWVFIFNKKMVVFGCIVRKSIFMK